MQDWGEQLDLFGKNGFPQPLPSTIREAEKTALRIAKSCGLKVSTVQWKSNRKVMASIGKHGVLNLQKIYRRAKEPDFKVLINVIKGKATDPERKKFEKFIERHLPRELADGKSRLVIMPPRGLFHDLEKARDKVLGLLGKMLRPMPKVGWSPARVGYRGITWGTQRETPSGPLILVNAVLDANEVPNYVIEHIVWHEICHQASPPENGKNGRRRVHGAAFRELEERYPRLKQAEEWEQKQVARLIRRHYKRRF